MLNGTFMGKGAEKYKNLDGLRGLAAFIVMLWHFCVGFLPFLIGFQLTTRYTPIDHLVSNTPLFLPLAGSFCVTVFFVLSGFVLSLSFFKTRDNSVLASSAARRYFRLAIPAASSILLAFIAMSLIGIHAHDKAAEITGSKWLHDFWQQPASLISMIYQGIYSTFVTGFTPYNTNLWTMQIELFGSFLVFGFLAFFGKLEKRWIFYAAAALIFLKTYYLAFILGMAICDIWTNGSLVRRYVTDWLVLALLPVGLFLGSWHTSLNVYPNIYSPIVVPYFNYTELEIFARIAGAAIIMLAVLQLAPLKRFFESKPLQYLGKLSFSLYLVHFIVIYSFSSWLFSTLYPHLGFMLSFFIMFCISTPLIFGISHLFMKYIDIPSIGWSKAIGSWLTSPRQAPQKESTEQTAKKEVMLPTGTSLVTAETAES
jgi:peptidoglycan/LPS O-acetylase OafA/YrhL